MIFQENFSPCGIKKRAMRQLEYDRNVKESESMNGTPMTHNSLPVVEGM